MNPDGTEQKSLYGSGSMFPNSIFDVQPLPKRTNRFVGVISGHHGVARSGRLMIFDPAKSRKEEKGMIQEYNPEIRVDQITKSFELALSLLSMSFGYGTKKYSFENGQITTATEYMGERQDQMQELNRQRQEAIRYIQDICKAVMWFANTFQGKAFTLNQEIMVDFDDSYITDREAELERKRNDALSFDIPELTIWYLMEAYSLTEDEAKKLVKEKLQEEEDQPTGEDED